MLFRIWELKGEGLDVVDVDGLYAYQQMVSSGTAASDPGPLHYL